PHPDGKTAEQVYNGLAGLIYIEDDNSKDLDLPDKYGENDIPLIFQDKTFDDKKQLNYDAAMDEDGTIGDTSLLNGKVNPKLAIDEDARRGETSVVKGKVNAKEAVNNEKVRLR